MDFEFTGDIWYWRGPAPFYFVSVPPEESEEIREISSEVTYGWGMIPVEATTGATTWETAMFAKDGIYVLPVKVAVRRAESIDEGDVVNVRLRILSAQQP